MRRMVKPGVERVGINVFAEFSRLSQKYGATNLGQGFPSFGLEPFVQKALSDVIQEDNHQYTRPGGHVELVQTLSELYSPIYGRQLDPMREIVTFHGAQQGIAAVVSTFLETGDTVGVLEPYFDAYTIVSKAFRMKIAGLPLHFSGSEKKASAFRLYPDKLDAFLTENKVKLFILNTPHNPLGKVFSKEELSDIVQVLEKHPDVLLLSDEVYEFMCFDGLRHERIATFPGMYERTISLFSAGKTFSCTGWRVGYAIAPPQLAQPLLETQSMLTFCGATPFELTIAKSFAQARENDYFTRHATRLQTNRDRLVRALQENGWQPIEPQGGYFVCCDVSKLAVYAPFADIEINDDLPKEEYPDYQFALALCRDHKLTTIPISPFYSKAAHISGRGMIRLAFCKDEKALDKAIEIIKSLGTK